MKLTTDFIDRWSKRYPLGEPERGLFTSVGPNVHNRGHYLLDELLAVVTWKNKRGRAVAAGNTADEVEQITGAALGAPDEIKHRILTLLKGVRVPVASALLAVWDPGRFTVLDFRAIESLRTLGIEGASGWPTARNEYPKYMDYLEVCRGTATDLKVPLRDLDRALWQFSKDGLPGDL